MIPFTFQVLMIQAMLCIFHKLPAEPRKGLVKNNVFINDFAPANQISSVEFTSIKPSDY